MRTKRGWVENAILGWLKVQEEYGRLYYCHTANENGVSRNISPTKSVTPPYVVIINGKTLLIDIKNSNYKTDNKKLIEEVHNIQSNGGYYYAVSSLDEFISTIRNFQ